MSKIISSLKNFRDRTQASLTVKSSNVLFFIALFMVVILAIIIRLSPIVENNYLIKAFDPWIQYYNADYLSNHSVFEYFNWLDFKSWYPEGFDRGSLRPGLTFTVVIIYQLLNSIGIPVSLYNVCYFFPAFMGGVSVFAAYLVGKEILDRKCGLMAAFFLAFNIGFMQRTTAGFFDNETIGVFASLMTFYFFLKAIKTGRFVHSVLGGVFLGYLALSWGGYDFVFLLLPLIVGILILVKKYDSNVLIAYAGVQGVGLTIYSIYTIFDYGDLFSSLNVGGIFIFTILLVVFHLIFTKKSEYPKIYNSLLNFLKWGLIPIVIILAIIIWVAPEMIPFGFGTRIQSILSPLLRDQMNLVASVAEHMPSPWSVFYYNTLIPLMLVPLGIFFLFKRSSPSDIFMILFIILIFYFTGSMIRIILLFAPAACLVAAYGLVNVLKIFGSFYGEQRAGVSRKRKRQIKRMVGRSEIAAVYVIVGIMCMAQVMHASNIAITQLSSSQIAPGGDFHDWEESLTWMKTNLPGSTVVVSWWDYGYWLTPIGNMTTVNDNATINQTRIGMTGMAMMQTNEIYSAKVFRRLKADYVLVYFGFLWNGLGGDEGKWPWMVRICNDNYEFYKKLGMEEDNWAENSVFVESEYYDDEAQAPTPLWFQSTLVKLMFYGLPTAPYTGDITNFVYYYQNQINTRTDNEDNLWSTNIPANGAYEFNVFKPAYTSSLGMVKLFKVDYTALDSSFEIRDPEVFDSGYATLNLVNTGLKDLEILDVQVNGQSFDFSLGKGINTNIINSSDDDLIWVDIKGGGKTYNEDDVASITIVANSTALDGNPYIFTNKTSNFFVKKSLEGEIRINKANSKVVQVNATRADLYLEVENIGDTTVALDEFYADSIENTFTEKIFISGSSILLPGEKAYVHLPNSIVSFYPVRTEHKIGVITPNGIKDEILLTSNYENYDLKIFDLSRILSPEVAAANDDVFRKHIPILLNETYAYTYDNGTTLINVRVKNTGDIILGMDSVYLKETDSWISVDFDPKENLYPGEELNLTIVASDYFDVEVNDEIGVIVTALFDGSTKASDIGFIHTINESADIKILENVQGTTTSFIAANETGEILVKNTGNQPILLDKIYLNETTEINISNETEFVYGDTSLGIQECALFKFNIPNLSINSSDQLNVRLTTDTTAEAYYTFSASVNSVYYNILINETQTSASKSGNLIITIDNEGLLNVTVDSVYINNTYIPLAEFNEIIFEIGTGESIQLTITTNDLQPFIGTINEGDDLEILVRTEEGAEYLLTESVTA